MTDDDASALEAPLFSVSVSDAGHGRYVVAAAGELDISTSPQLLAAVGALVQGDTSAAGAIAIDLSALTFIDSSGINALRGAVRAANERGIGAIVAAPSQRVLRVMELVRLGEIIPLEDSLPAGFERHGARSFGDSAGG